MALNRSKLENIVELGNGAWRARCPACAEGGRDRTGEHLRVTPDGRFGCCVYPKDPEHRRRIFQLAGERDRKEPIKVRVAAIKPTTLIQANLIGRIGRAFDGQTAVVNSTDASDGVGEVKNAETEVRTARTGGTESNSGSTSAPAVDPDKTRTARTPFQYSSICTSDLINNSTAYYIKEFAGGVRNVREVESESPEDSHLDCGEGVRSVRTEKEELPYLTQHGTLVIPFSSPERYHWWKGGQTAEQTKLEILERMKAHGVSI